MKHRFSKRYQAALLAYLEKSPAKRLRTVHGMGQQALDAGLKTSELARLHEQILVTRVLPGQSAGRRATLVRQAGVFFAEAIVSIEAIHSSHRAAAIRLNHIVEMLSQRTVELAASNLELQNEIVQRKAVESALKKSEHHHSELLKQSDHLQEQLRQLSRQIILAQEEERKEISRELHDVIAQTLTGINVRLAALSKEAAINPKGLEKTSPARSGWWKSPWISSTGSPANSGRPCWMISA